MAGIIATMCFYGMLDIFFFNRLVTRFMVRVPLETGEKYMQVYKLLEDTVIAKKGSIGICIGEYELGGKFILFGNGNYDGFNSEEQVRFLTKIGEETQHYIFSSAINLYTDFNNKIFDNVFKKYNLLDHT